MTRFSDPASAASLTAATASSGSGHRREAVAVVVLFAALTLGMTYPLVLHLGDALPGDLGDPLLNAWILAWDADRLADGLRGLWQAPIFHPYPNTLAYSEHLLGIAVLVAPVQWLFGNLVLTYNMAFFLSYLLAGCGMYLLVRSLTGCPWAGVVAGIAFAFCPYRVPQVFHLQVLTSGWMPIGLWALHRYHVTGRRLALVGSTGAFVMQGLSNGYYLFFFALPVVVVGLYAVCRPRHPRRRMVLDLGLGALAVLIVFAPIALVYYGLQRSQGLVRGVSEVTHYGADLASYAHVYPSSFLWSRWLSEGAPERELFAGLVVMVLAAAALVGSVRRRPRRHVPPDEPAAPSISTPTLTWLYGAIALLAVLFSLGPEPTAWGTPILPVGPYRLAMSLVPGLDGLRVPARLAMVVYLALSVLAGIGVAHYFAGLSTRVRAGLGASLATLVLLEGYGPTPYETLPRDGRSFDAAVYTWLADRPSGAVLELPMEGRHENLQAHHTLRYQYRTLEHGHPLVNGFSGYSSLLVDFLPVAPMWDRAVTGDLLRGLRLIGVRYVIVHEQLYVDQSLARATVAALRAQRDEVATVHTVGTTHVFDLGEVSWPRQASPLYTDDDGGVLPGGLSRVSARSFRADASHARGLLPLAFDGDTETRWSTGTRQQGTEWITLAFDQPRSIARVRLELTGRSWGDYPRLLRIESSTDGETFDRVVFEARGLPVLIASLPRGTKAAPIELDLLPNVSAALRFLQLGTTDAWLWSIDEMTLWARESRSP